VTGENLTVGGPVWLPAESLAPAIGNAALEGLPDAALLDAVPHVPLPGNRLEELVLGGLLTERAAGGPCAGVSEIEDRLHRLAGATTKRRGVPVASRAAMIVREQPQRQLAVAAIARLVRCDQTRLRRAFRAKYGMTLREYHLRARVSAALTLMAAGTRKTGAIAVLVGYSGETNFYRAVRRFTGCTPGRLREYPAEKLLELAARVLPPELLTSSSQLPAPSSQLLTPSS
jgi:AraC-like DNA-binding protein